LCQEEANLVKAGLDMQCQDYKRKAGQRRKVAHAIVGIVEKFKQETG